MSSLHSLVARDCLSNLTRRIWLQRGRRNAQRDVVPCSLPSLFSHRIRAAPHRSAPSPRPPELPFVVTENVPRVHCTPPSPAILATSQVTAGTSTVQLGVAVILNGAHLHFPHGDVFGFSLGITNSRAFLQNLSEEHGPLPQFHCHNCIRTVVLLPC